MTEEDLPEKKSLLEDTYETIKPALQSEDQKAKRKKRRKAYFFMFLGLELAIVMITYLFAYELSHLFIVQNVMTMFIGTVIWGFLLGLIFSLIPFKNSNYKVRYLNTSLLIMALLNGLIFFGLVLNLIVLNIKN